MLSSPVWRGRAAAAFCVGLMTGGAVAALAFLVVGSLLRGALPWGARALVLTVVVGFALLKEFGLIDVRLPENQRLVPESVFRHGRLLGPFQFGLEMGTGTKTYLPSSLPYAAAVAVALFATPAIALLTGVGFGCGRALMTVSNLRFDRLGDWNDVWAEHAAAIRLLVCGAFVIALASAALPLLSSAVGPLV